MNLREWMTNYAEVRISFASSDRSEETVAKVLGTIGI